MLLRVLGRAAQRATALSCVWARCTRRSLPPAPHCASQTRWDLLFGCSMVSHAVSAPRQLCSARCQTLRLSVPEVKYPAEVPPWRLQPAMTHYHLQDAYLHKDVLVDGFQVSWECNPAAAAPGSGPAAAAAGSLPQTAATAGQHSQPQPAGQEQPQGSPRQPQDQTASPGADSQQAPEALEMAPAASALHQHGFRPAEERPSSQAADAALLRPVACSLRLSLCGERPVLSAAGMSAQPMGTSAVPLSASSLA